MAGNNPRKHVRFEGHYENQNYKYPRGGGSSFVVKSRNRATHGARILRQLEQIREQFSLAKEVELPPGIVRDDAIYVEFISDWESPLKFESLEQDRENPSFQILNIREELRVVNQREQFRYYVTLMMREGGISQFITKAKDYLTKNIIYKGEDTGNPRNYKLINNIQRIQQATLQAFWTDAPEIPFPNENEIVWWEVWFRKTNNDGEKIKNVLENLRLLELQIGASELEFAEHRVRLVRASARQLSQSLMLLDNLAELRKPQEIADFITHKGVSYSDKKEWLDDLIARTEIEFNENSVLVCLLDSGVNNLHPLISSFLPDERLYSYKPDDWGLYDSWPNEGHGTGMAGLALYGDLIEVFDSKERIRILHGLESYKIFQNGSPNDPELYGAITEEACNTPLVDSPNHLRVFCMSITDEQFAFKGRPSAWSAAIDKIAFGSNSAFLLPQLFIVSGGNVKISRHDEYPLKNYDESVHDPGQAYNAITVGAYTRKDRIDPDTGYTHLAPYGAMSPCNSTSFCWDYQWPLKPDIVMEGGNCSTDGEYTADHSSLKLLTTDKDFNNFLFVPFGDTSGAAALAAKMAAELRTTYPEYWPETIRALIIHSAEWTTAMLNGYKLSKEADRRAILRTVGYGVPIKEKALYSANNSLTLIAERVIQPYRLQGSTTKYNEYHLFNLPWPVDILSEFLSEHDVKLKVTLSYFVEPNPGSRNNRYANNFQYHSHELDFAVIKQNERLDVFKRRISADQELPEEELNRRGEEWTIGRVRSRGSIKKDFITMSGADMAVRNILAVFPKNGWYKTRKKLNKVEQKVRYSLIVTLETPNTDVDIYTPVITQIENTIGVMI